MSMVLYVMDKLGMLDVIATGLGAIIVISFLVYVLKHA